MKIFITVQEQTHHEDGYKIEKVFTDYKEAQDSLLEKGYRLLDEEYEIYVDEQRKDGYTVARIFEKNL